jgi:outer membrane protein OmpA-like peptidoglycan-associated protein
LFSGCGGTQEAAKTDETRSDTTTAATSDTSKLDVAQLRDSSSVDELDYVPVTTDERINPVRLIRLGLINDTGLPMETLQDDTLGCRYAIPKDWVASQRRYKNLVNYYGNDKISVIISVARPTFDSVSIWAQVQEAIAFGKNQLPRDDWALSADLNTSRTNTTQNYFGRYEFRGKQYNLAFFKSGELQYNVLIDHPLKSLTEQEAKAINYIFASFVVTGKPKVEIPLPVKTTFSDAAAELKNVGDTRSVDLPFAKGSDKLPSNTGGLDIVVELLQAEKGTTVGIYAYADDVTLEKRKNEKDSDFKKRLDAARQRIGLSRSRAIVGYLKSKGIAASRLRAEYDPKVTGLVTVKVLSKKADKSATATASGRKKKGK